MRVLVELLRIVFLFIFGGALVWGVLGPFYHVHPISGEYQWLGVLGVYGILFVLYRNRWQFSGWYKGRVKKKRPRRMTRIIVFASVLLMASPWVITTINQ
ncbi:hypothetical protein LC065_12765 [Halobacillus litoralis]|uniref:hypothetical protein n=1 Tax=Halobacillus litoralis TaxID=45668 RepID=UPI001CFC6670|nr:hypothetical protein [Halobacillus litoralis]WLR46448.1 hypothetical protein LC065_12765 [Halobacillus litoralis]